MKQKKVKESKKGKSLIPKSLADAFMEKVKADAVIIFTLHREKGVSMASRIHGLTPNEVLNLMDALKETQRNILEKLSMQVIGRIDGILGKIINQAKKNENKK